MSVLDLGALVGRVALDDIQFQRTYVRVVRQMSDLGVKAKGSAAGTAALDRGLADTAASGNAAAIGLGRANKAMTEADIAASRVAAAEARAAEVTTELGLAHSKLTQATLRQTAAQERYDVLLATGTASTRQLAAAEATLIGANDRVALSTERMGKASGFTSDAWQKAGRGLLISGGLIAAGFALAGKEAAGFDAKMAQLRSLARDASAEELAQLRDAALNVGQAYGYTASEVADAQIELVKAGISVKDILGGALVGALTLAAAGQLDVADATEIATIAMTDFHLAGKDVPHIADLLAAGADKALGSVQELGEGLKYGALASAQADQSIENTIGTLAEFAQAGLLGSSAGSALAMMLQNLQKPSDQATSMMDRYNISLYNADGTTKSYTQIAGELHRSLSDLPPAERQAALATIFTSRARRAATILTVDGAKANREWTESVNDQGFAALQAAGKLDSLSGDWQKFKAAMTSAIIGTGEGAQGPLRELVQDATAVINAWNDLPEPVRLAAEALFGVAGAAALAGGAALLLIPKWAAMNAALAETTGRAVTARGALMGVGKVSGAALGLVAVYEGAKLLQGALEEAGPSVEDITAELIDMGKAGSDSANDLINTLVNLSQVDFGIRGPDLSDWGDLTRNLDAALSDLVTGGHADMAAADFQRINEALQAAGLSTEEITALFPTYGRALADSANQAELAGTGIDSYGNAVGDAAKETQDAIDAAKAYSDALHALADPLFAMNSALQDLADKQHAATKAVNKYGADSKQARQANLDLASSALDVETASRTLATAVETGTVSLRDARGQLRAWVHDGLLTEGQAKAVAGSFGGLIDKANDLHPALGKAGSNAPSVAKKLDTLGVSAWNLSSGLGAAGAAAATSFGHGFMGTWGGVIDSIHSAIANLPKVHGSPSVNEMAPVLFIHAGEMLMGGLALGIERGTPDAIHAAHRALRVVQEAVADAVRPEVTDPTQLAASLGRREGRAVSLTAAVPGAHQAFREAHDDYKALNDDLKALQRQHREDEHEANRYARYMRGLADDAQHAADKISDKDKAAKAEAERAARDADRAANQAERNARRMERDDARAERLAQKAVDRAKRVADAQKAAWDKAAQAAERATQKAAEAAQALISAVSDQVDELLGQFNDFRDTISGGLRGDWSLGSLWTTLTDNLTSAADDLAEAQQNVADAQQGLLDATNPREMADATEALATAQQALADAQTAYDTALANRSATGLQTNLDQILASTENFATDLNTLLAEGAGQELITELVGMGVDAGDGLAQALIAAGPDAIAGLQASMAAIQAAAGSEADLLAGHFYDGGLLAMEKFILGLEEKFPELRGALEAIVAQIDAMLGLGAVPSIPTPRGGWGRIIDGAPTTPIPVQGGDGASLPNLGAVVDRLERIEARLVDAPALTGQAVGDATVAGFKSAGAEQATMNMRLSRKL